MKPIFALIISATFIMPGFAFAQAVNSCEEAGLNEDSIVQPASENQRTYSDGKTRISIIDSGSDRAWKMISVVSPPFVNGQPTCQVISFDDYIGFEEVLISLIESRYDPSIGLMFDIPVRTPEPEYSDKLMRLIFDLNQATGALSAEFFGFIEGN